MERVTLGPYSVFLAFILPFCPWHRKKEPVAEVRQPVNEWRDDEKCIITGGKNNINGGLMRESQQNECVDSRGQVQEKTKVDAHRSNSDHRTMNRSKLKAP